MAGLSLDYRLRPRRPTSACDVCGRAQTRTHAGLSVVGRDEALVAHTQVGSYQVLTEGVVPAHRLIGTLVDICGGTGGAEVQSHRFVISCLMFQSYAGNRENISKWSDK